MGAGAGSRIVQRTHLPLGRWMLWSRRIVGAAILTLAILNPLLCLLHCALSHHTTITRSSDQQHFICDLAGTFEPAAAPFSLVWSGPRAVYEVVPIFSVSLVLITLIATMVRVLRACAPQHIPCPALPPPKMLVLR